VKSVGFDHIKYAFRQPYRHNEKKKSNSELIQLIYLEQISFINFDKY